MSEGELKPERLLLRVEEAAEHLRLSRAKVYELLANGDIPSITIGRSRRIPYAELKRWTEQKLAAQS